MKKNKAMRVASILLVAVLITTCALSGTFAKYVTSGTASDSARVAKFGIVVSNNADMFNVQYEADDTSAGLEYSVISSTADKVVAPGTSGTILDAALSGTAEVATALTISNFTMTLENWAVNDGQTYYCPIVINVGGTDGTDISGLDYDDAETFAAAVETAIEELSAVIIPANTDLDEDTEYTLPSITWSWAFEGAEDSTQTDELDTALGQQAADGNAATIDIELTIAVTQID